MDNNNPEDPPLWSGKERRELHLTEDRVKLMIERAVSARADLTELRIIKHLDIKVAEIRQELKEHSDEAFPEGNRLRHRSYHEAVMTSAERWQKIRTDVISNTLKGMLWAGLVFIGIAAWEYVAGRLATANAPQQAQSAQHPSAKP